MLDSFTLRPLRVVLVVAALCLMRLFYSVDTRSVALAGSHRRNALAQEHIYRSDDRNKDQLNQNQLP
ncbi:MULTISPECIES: hypothetical protein [Klebsiella pneumoniae complex]|uniref:hypothetical protein n=1 Tax=Klebsiella pneumoniae complex TaxID=3390273 RepID=UPI0015E9FCD7|nr:MULTISPECIES: hypothetical protein [Klebsiella]MCT4359923.1 hypothetical protein [Klebsiella pneumoniae]MDZ0185283.1 hypothetical protein [Klebsiella quasipneumoniae]MEA4382316.1 hypothetical protein [Klebsiella pneumoniae]QLW71136.1 hypothetical protein HV282_19295 [Klebsiella pneumoniae]HDY8627565.1 hypothetical protein [Klebsiella pneumoniae]